MKVAIGTDISGLFLKDAVKKHLSEAGHEVFDLGMHSIEEGDVLYSEAVENVANAILSGMAERGILICRTGGGMTITANKYKGIYALLCESPYTARMASTISGCNVLCMGQCIVGADMGCDMADEFLSHSHTDGFTPEQVELSRSLIKHIYETEARNFK